MNLGGKTALVTGAGQGIGKGCALELARAGAALIINDRPDNPALQRTTEEILALGGSCRVLAADVFSRAGAEQLVADAISQAGRLDILVSNPAYSRRSDFLDTAPEEFEKVVNGTLISGFHISQLAARHMVERGGGGKIVFISSVLAEFPSARSSAYNAAKAGLNQLMRTMAVELSSHRINVNAIEPGWIDTPGERKFFSEECIKEEGRRLPWGRLGTPADIGAAAVFLSSDEADYITGVVLPVDGGYRSKDCRAETQISDRPQHG